MPNPPDIDRCSHNTHIDIECADCLAMENEGLADVVDRLSRRVTELEAQKDGAYRERDRLVAALSKLIPSHMERHPELDVDWEDDWRWIVFVAGPAGQMSWHIHDSELSWFDHLARRTSHSWDGHSTEEKYERLSALGGSGVEME